jgi:sugar/nucleoside kinase (ribokinase family)
MLLPYPWPSRPWPSGALTCTSVADGAPFFANGRPPVRVPAPPVEQVIDGTGASDAFVAGFLSVWLDKKLPMQALASGCRLAAHALNLIGARPVVLAHRHAA